MIKSRRTKVVATVIVIVGVFWALIFYYMASHSSSPTYQTSPIGHSSPPERNVTSNPIPVADNNTTQKRMLLQYNSNIQFYGLVIDQNGKPVKGAKVSYNIQMAGDLQPQFGLQRKDKGVVYSSDNGIFQIRNKKGMYLDISSIELDGYREVRGGAARGYNFGSGSVQHAADPNRPVGFLLIDTTTQKPLVKSFKLAFVWDAKAVSVRVDGSDVVIVFVPYRDRPPGALRGFDWSMEISVQQGEICRLAPESPLIAPIEGYRSSVRYGVLAKEPGMPKSIRQESLVFRTKDGKYGRIMTNLYVDREIDSTAAYVTVYFNPSGGRNLE